jgi:hypothetical protein
MINGWSTTPRRRLAVSSYHLNGQQSLDIQGDKATGTAYCLAVLIEKSKARR